MIWRKKKKILVAGSYKYKETDSVNILVAGSYKYKETDTVNSVKLSLKSYPLWVSQ